MNHPTIIFALFSAGSISMLAHTFPLPALEAEQRVEATKLVRVGKDTLSYRRITPPPLRDVMLAEPAPNVISSQPQIEEVEPQEWFHFSYTVTPYAKNTSEVKWVDEQGRTKRVFAHHDLEYLEASFSFGVDNVGLGYSIMGFGSHASIPFATLPAPYRRYISMATQLPVGHFVQVPSEDGKTFPISQAEADALDVMLAYYALNREDLKRRHLEAQAIAIKEAEAQRIEDAKPKNIEIRYWPVKSQRYNTSSR